MNLDFPKRIVRLGVNSSPLDDSPLERDKYRTTNSSHIFKYIYWPELFADIFSFSQIHTESRKAALFERNGSASF